MILDLFVMAVTIVFIIDISGVIENLEEGLSKWLKGKVRIPKPFSCSLCSMWWLGLIYLWIYSQLTLVNISIVALFAILTPVISSLLVLVRETLLWVVGKAYNALK
jgi:hypothetical protein